MSCSFEECDNDHYARTFCHGHWKQQNRGEPQQPLRKRRRGKKSKYTLEELLSWTERQGNCLVWIRADNKQGYGIAQHDGKSWMAHRLSYHLATGEEIGRQVIHHACANSMCINPEHLQLARHAENNLEMLARRDYEARIAALEAQVKELEAQLEKARTGRVVAVR